MATFFESLKSYVFPEPGATQPDVPDGVCPNCWGRQEYAGEIRAAVRDRRIDVQNDRAKDAFIQDFVVKHVDGVRLRAVGGQLTCPMCETPS